MHLHASYKWDTFSGPVNEVLRVDAPVALGRPCSDASGFVLAVPDSVGYDVVDTDH